MEKSRFSLKGIFNYSINISAPKLLQFVLNWILNDKNIVFQTESDYICLIKIHVFVEIVYTQQLTCMIVA